jgi:transposase
LVERPKSRKIVCTQ